MYSDGCFYSKYITCESCKEALQIKEGISGLTSMQLNQHYKYALIRYVLVFGTFYSRVSNNRTKWKTPFHMPCKEG